MPDKEFQTVVSYDLKDDESIAALAYFTKLMAWIGDSRRYRIFDIIAGFLITAALIASTTYISWTEVIPPLLEEIPEPKPTTSEYAVLIGFLSIGVIGAAHIFRKAVEHAAYVVPENRDTAEHGLLTIIHGLIFVGIASTYISLSVKFIWVFIGIISLTYLRYVLILEKEKDLCQLIEVANKRLLDAEYIKIINNTIIATGSYYDPELGCELLRPEGEAMQEYLTGKIVESPHS